MKAFLKTGLCVLFAGVSMISCKDDEDYETIQSADRIKVDSVRIVNDTMDVLTVQSIRTFSTFNSKCEGFYGYDYVHSGNFGRDVTAYQYHTNGSCSEAKYVGANQINFNPQQVGKYTFRFWTGDNTWITKTIVVE